MKSSALRICLFIALCLAGQAWAGVSVSLTAPANGSVHQAGINITLSATATANKGYTLSKVEFFQGTTLIGTDTSAPYSIVWNGVPAGNHSLTAKATATKKNKPDVNASSAAVNISVNASAVLLYFIHVDHLNTPRLVANQDGQTVWRWDQQEPFGNSVPDENPAGLGNFEFPLRLPGQYLDKETNLHYNYYRDYDPSLGMYKQSDPIGLKGGLNTYAYGYGDPLAVVDLKGLDVEVGVRKFYPIGLPLVRHCFVRFSGNNSNTLGFNSSGVGPDANPGGAGYSPTVGPENDSCVREQMLKCRDYAFFTNNCCDCVAYAPRLWLKQGWSLAQFHSCWSVSTATASAHMRKSRMPVPMNSTRHAASRLWIAVVVLIYAAWSAFWVGVCAFPVAEECISATLVLYVTGFPVALLTVPMSSSVLHVVAAAGLGALQWGLLAALIIRRRSTLRETTMQSH